MKKRIVRCLVAATAAVGLAATVSAPAQAEGFPICGPHFGGRVVCVAV